MNDFDDELRRSLHNRADQVPRRPDLGRGAIAQARGIRRRRRVAGVVATAAVVAVAVPIGLRIGDVMPSGDQESIPPATPSGPVNVKLDLRELPDGDPPSIPYVDGSTFVGDGLEIDISDGGPPASIAPVTDGVYTTGANWRLTYHGADGDTDELGRVQPTPVASADGRWLAYVTREPGENGNPVATLNLLDEDGDPSTVELDDASPQAVAIHAIVDGTVYLTYDTRRGHGVPLQTWSDGNPEPEPVPGDLDATAVSSDGNLVARLTSLDDSGTCSTIVNLDTGDETPESCDYQVRGFTTDNRYAWSAPAYMSGYAATSFGIVDSQTGEIVRKYNSASQRRVISFMNATFEDDDSLLIQAEQGNQTALVRCEIMTDDCELATPLADGTAHPPGGPPYVLPSMR